MSYLLFTKYGIRHTVFTHLPAARGVRTRDYKGKGSIYEVVDEPGLGPHLELVDSQ
ncbi:hypothetical protein FDH96_gp095 [Mycobacterium phage Rey]|uniref:Uncharacterized protein n=1 Tax=Mycobacterium phage Rey TaxID=1034115 RepID=G1D5F7_9CAUD|nr:hypothetical protein FDH96_gp095 [Mycobacterium phage Rey]AEK10006.1 hypothetical protein PBI_REY_95 [Mycobacterium phage Rey]